MPRNKPKLLLLDTHIWIWLMNADAILNHKTYLRTIEEYSEQEALRISAISVWELGMLVAKKRLILSNGLYAWVQESLKTQGLSVEPLSIDILLESTQLGNHAHADPADRMIVSTAKHLKATLMTADAKMISYCLDSNLPVFPIK